MKLKWQNIHEIVYELEEKYPKQDIYSLSFPQLRKMVVDLEAFDDDPKKCNEAILEAIQQTWSEERE